MSNLTRLAIAAAVVAVAAGHARAQGADANGAVPAELPPQPQPPPQQPPPPGIETEFVSTESQQWEVMVDQQSTCVTPCRLQLDRPRWITLRSRERSPLRLEIGELGHRPSRVLATPLGTGKWATGITFTAIGGTAGVVGIVLTAVGCSTDRSGMCKAGLITGGAGLAVTGLGIWLIRRGLPRYTVRAIESRGYSLYVNGAGGGVAGRF